jgi:hypothetical protein
MAADASLIRGNLRVQSCFLASSKITLSPVRSLLGPVLALFLSLDLAEAAEVNASVYSVAGNVEFAGPGSISFSPLKQGQTLALGTTIRTGDDGTAVLSVTPGSSIQVGHDSILKVNELAFARTGSQVTQRKARLQLTSGAVSALIDPSTPKATDFQIQTPQGAAAARGTFYAVIVRDGQTFVRVGRGRVAATTSMP